MKQEINLYQYFAIQSSEGNIWLNWRALIWSNVLFIIFFLFLVLLDILHFASLEVKKSEILHQIRHVQKKIDIKDQYLPLFLSKGITVEEAIKKINNDVAVHQKILNEVTNPIPFSQYLLSLSQSVVPEVWLTRIFILKGGTEVRLQGRSLNIYFLREYFKKVMIQNTYAQMDFTVNNIEPLDTKNSENTQITFDVTLKQKL